MHKNRLLRVAAATTMTAILTVGAVMPAQAESQNGKGAQRSAAARADDAGEVGTPRGAADKSAKPTTKENRTTGPDHSNGNASTRGDHTEPQPESRADRNDGGANGGSCETDPRHSYCSTRDGSPSMNGNGGGAATGKPCAGCVGKADNKNPKGQYPHGGDHNAGYECDTNNGVGKSNPAHTGCTASDTPAPQPENPGPVNPEPETPGPVTPEPETPGPVNPEPETPGPVTPEPETPGPVNPEPETPGPVEEEVCPEGATMNDAGECIVAPVEEEVCPEGATMNDSGECVVPAITTPANPGEVLGVDLERGTPGGAVAAPAVNRAPAKVAAATVESPAAAAGVLPATGAGSYLAAIVAGLGLLTAGGVLLARRPETAR